MNDTSERIPCPHCQAQNFPSSATCWQCGQPMRAQQDQPPAGTPPPPGPGEPPPAPGYTTPPPPARDNTQTLVILGFVFAGLGLFCCPVFSIVGIILGVMVSNRGNPIGTWITVASVATLIIGLIWVAVGWASFWRTFNQAQQGYQPGQPIPMPR